MNNPINNMMLSRVKPGWCRMSFKGQIAVRCSDGSYKTYNTKTKRLVNCSQFVLPIADDFFFVVPTTKAKPGDIIIANGKPKCVISATPDELRCVNYENNTIETILPERHVFFGKTYFYGKIVSLLGKKAFGGNGLMKIIMLSKMFSGNGNGISLPGFDGSAATTGTSNTDGGGMFSSLMPMLMMGNIFGGGMKDMGEIFDFGLDDEDSPLSFVGDDDEEDDSEEEESEG